jgi:hypothetical protein
MSEATNPFPITNDKVKTRSIDGRSDWSSPHHYPDRHKRFPAQETLIGSYLHQQYRFQNKKLNESKTKTKDHNLDGVILTAWNQFGKPTQEVENLENNADLKAHLEKRNLNPEPILTLASNFRWLEDAYLVKGLTFQEAEDIATAYGQLAFIILHDNKATLRLTTNASFMGLPRDYEETTYVNLTEVTYNHCPARYPAADESKCTMVGGPFGSAAIHAAGIWQTTRNQFLSRLGCDPCSTQPAQRGGAILLHEPCMPSRFGGFQWESEPYLAS